MYGNLEEPFVVSKNFQFPAFQEVNIQASPDFNKLINLYHIKIMDKVSLFKYDTF